MWSPSGFVPEWLIDVRLFPCGFQSPSVWNDGIAFVLLWKKDRMECCQDRIYIWSISTVFLRTLGHGDIDPVVGKHPLEVSFDRVYCLFGIRTSWRQIMGGPCSNILCISFLPLWYPWGPTFHDTAFSTVLVETEPAILRLTSQLSFGFFFGARRVEFRPAFPSCKDRG